MPNEVGVERDAEVGVIVIDNPPVNAASAAVRAGLLNALVRLNADASIGAIVIIGAGPTFIAGADLREFRQPLAEPQLPDVIRAIETGRVPVVAALSGSALGGGFELALGCDARIAAPGTLVGLPEVTLGIIPGAGGTQRLPRRVGVARAIQMICSGERLTSSRALALGLIDREATGELRAAAVAHARSLGGKKSPLRDRVVPPEEPAAVEAAAAAALKAGKNRPAVRAAIAAVIASASRPIDQGLAEERSVFQTLRTSREAAALRHQFFAERSTAKLPALDGIKPRPVRDVLVVGAGTMGSGIAIAALDAGFAVTLLEQNPAALQAGRERIGQHYAGRIAGGKMSEDTATQRQARLSASVDWSAARAADLLIEAVYEDLTLKRAVFRRLDEMAKPGAVLATNTSYLDIDAIAGATARPQDVIGLHFFSPANVMRLVEVVRGAASAPDALATGIAVAKQLGKLPVLASNAFGFIGNRIYSACRRQCEFMLEEGALPQQVDAALQAFGFAMGPFAVGDMAGLDIAWRMRQAQAANRDPAARYVQIPDRLCEAGRLGRKTGAGYYAYPRAAAAPETDPAVQALIERASADKGIARRTLDAEEIQSRAILAMVNEAARLLDEDVVQRASDIDVVLVNGYGFPRWEGGPVFWGRERGRTALENDLARLEQLSGRGWVRGRLDALWQDE